MGVEGRFAGVFKFFLVDFAAKRRTLFRPFLIVVVEDLGHCAPTDILDQHRFFVRAGGSLFRLQFAKRLDGSDVLEKLLLRAARAQAVVVGNPVAVLIGDYRLAVSSGSRM